MHILTNCIFVVNHGLCAVNDSLHWSFFVLFIKYCTLQLHYNTFKSSRLHKLCYLLLEDKAV